MIDSVRSTVLSILNKNNYGYITPSDFNVMAKMAQVEIFNSYLERYNDSINKQNARLAGSDMADVTAKYGAELEAFLMQTELANPGTARFTLPSLSNGGLSLYKIENVLCFDTSSAPKIFCGEAEQISASRIKQLEMSPMTAPTKKYPAFTIFGNQLHILPLSITGAGAVELIWIRMPKDPKWTYITTPNGTPMFNVTAPDYQDFEIGIEEEPALVSKILSYAGVSIREADVVNYVQTSEQLNKK